MQHAFRGSIDVPVSLEALGVKWEIHTRFFYAYTPAWPYWDPSRNAEVTAEDEMFYMGEVLIEHREEDWLSMCEALDRKVERREWVEFTEGASGQMMEPVFWRQLQAAIDADARRQDEANRAKEPGRGAVRRPRKQ